MPQSAEIDHTHIADFFKTSRRILLKISGEALSGCEKMGIDFDFLGQLTDSLRQLCALGHQVNVVLGAGNFFRGQSGVKAGLSQVAGDNMGMIATIMNGVALQESLAHSGVVSRLISGVDCPLVAEPYHETRCLEYAASGNVLIFVGGTGSPFSTTDTAAVLRALEMRCDVLLKATQVDGVYTADPNCDPNAERIESILYRDVLYRGLRVMDATAIALASEYALNLMIFSLHPPSNILALLNGEIPFTLISSKENSGHGH